MMQAQEPPIYIVSLGRVYRRDTIDATHSPIFHQFEGSPSTAASRSPTCGARSCTLRGDVRRQREVRFRTHFFPFTEPSMELDISCSSAAARAAASASTPAGSRWAAPAMVDPAVFENVGYDPEEWTGFAFGMGMERIAFAAARRSPTCASFWENDLRVLRQF